MEKEIQVRLRRESIPEKNIDVWLAYDSDLNKDTRMDDEIIVSGLDNIYSVNNGLERERKLSRYLVEKDILDSEKKLKSFWLPSVEDALSASIKMFYNPSGGCPNKCLTCFCEDNHDFSLSEDVAYETMAQIVNLPIFWMNLGGCELSYYNPYFDFAEKAIKNGIHVGTAISGVGLTKEWAEKATDLGVKVKVSLDGPKEINDIQRPGTYEPAIEAIKMFRDLGNPVKINMVHTNLNKGAVVLDEMFKIAKENGAYGIDLSILRPKGGALKNNLMIPLEDYKNERVADFVNKFRKPSFGYKDIKTWVNRNLVGFDYTDAKPCQLLDIHCGAGRYNMGINSDGQIDSCFFLPEEYFPDANVNDPRLFENKDFLLNVWQKDPTLKEIRKLTKTKPCENCSGKGIDFVRGCQANATYYGGIDPATLLH